MAKKYTAKQCREMLHSVLGMTVGHIYIIEKQIASLKLKLDGTDSETDLKKAQVFTMVLTILNDAAHSAHGYMYTLYDSKIIDRFVANQKIAFDNKLVNPCDCPDCKQRGYKYNGNMAQGKTDETTGSEKDTSVPEEEVSPSSNQ